MGKEDIPGKRNQASTEETCSVCSQDCKETASINYWRIVQIKGSWKSGRRVVRKQICTMIQIKTSLKIFEQRTIVVLIIAVFGRNQSGVDTQDRVKKGEPQVKRPTGCVNRNDRTGCGSENGEILQISQWKQRHGPHWTQTRHSVFGIK